MSDTEALEALIREINENQRRILAVMETQPSLVAAVTAAVNNSLGAQVSQGLMSTDTARARISLPPVGQWQEPVRIPARRHWLRRLIWWR